MIKLIVSTDGKAAPFHMAHSTVPLISVPKVEDILKGSTHGEDDEGEFVNRHYAYIDLTVEQAIVLREALTAELVKVSLASDRPPFGSDPSGFTRV